MGRDEGAAGARGEVGAGWAVGAPPGRAAGEGGKEKTVPAGVTRSAWGEGRVDGRPAGSAADDGFGRAHWDWGDGSVAGRTSEASSDRNGAAAFAPADSAVSAVTAARIAPTTLTVRVPDVCRVADAIHRGR